mgnify:CR=1 FL=1
MTAKDNPFKFSVTFRAFHPSADLKNLLAILSTEIGLASGRIWMVGDDYFTQSGDRLIGKRKESYFFFPVENNVMECEEKSLLSVIEKLLINLQNVKNSLQEHTRTGGRLVFYISMYGTDNIGYTFSKDCIKKLADLNIELDIEFYSE